MSASVTIRGIGGHDRWNRHLEEMVREEKYRRQDASPYRLEVFPIDLPAGPRRGRIEDLPSCLVMRPSGKDASTGCRSS